MDKNIENYLKDKNILNIMNKVSFPYKNNIDYDEIDSIKMDILWDCINKYDPVLVLENTILFASLTSSINVKSGI